MKPDPSQITEIFAYWQKVMDHPRARLTADRKAAVRRRLAEGWLTKEQMERAAATMIANARGLRRR